MSYTVLARTWRPRRFAEMVGQRHVVKALVNSLAAERLHHAYLFAGTRGVGKTTLARILAKALNCAGGIVAEPCGTCEACTAIDDGRFVDLIEVDAASRTRVDDTRELMENTQYTPAQGRFKVYLIDEVHMLSNHSFNALLKTLEEPPPHIKFLLATTDPQKLPVTVLSRCLQFNLKRLTVAEIYQQLENIHGKEAFEAEVGGLKALARAADGSMRDGLSLLDQAIAFSAGDVTEEAVSAMLGSIDRQHVVRFVEALADLDGSALMNEVADLDERAPDYGTVLDELMGVLQRIAILQLVGSESDEETRELSELASKLTAEDVQLYYQIALQGRRDLGVCRDHRAAFEMTLLRMLAFRPGTGGGYPPEGKPPSPTALGGTENRRAAATGSHGQPRRIPAAQAKPSNSGDRLGRAKQPGTVGVPKSIMRAGEPGPLGQPSQPIPPNASGHEAEAPRAGVEINLPGPDVWHEFIAKTGITGAPRQLAEHCAVREGKGGRLELVLASESAHLNTVRVRNRLLERLQERFAGQVPVHIEVGEPPGATPAEIRAKGASERMRRAHASIEGDPAVKEIQTRFDAVLEVDSIRPLEGERA